MKKSPRFLRALLIALILNFTSGYLIAQPYLEDFEAAGNVVGNTTFTSNSVGWTTSGGNYGINVLSGTGWNGTANDNKYIDNQIGLDAQPANPDKRYANSGTIKTTGGSQFVAKKIWVFGSNAGDISPGNGIGTLTITGKLAGVTKFDVTIVKADLNTSFSVANGFTLIDFSTWDGEDNSNIFVDELVCDISGVPAGVTGWTYLAFDGFTWCASGCGSNTTVNSITPASSLTNASTVNYTATFGASITTIAASNFSLTTTGVSGASITGVSGSGATRTVTVNTGTGDGTIKVNLANSTSMSPGISTTLPFAGTIATIDKTIPTVSSINRQTPSGANTNVTTLVYRVTFSESVSGVDISDFVLTPGTSGAGTISSVSASSGTTIDVTVTSVSGEGTLRLDLKSSGTGIADAASNGISGYTGGQSYNLDHTAPSVSSINRQTPSGASTNATSVVFRVTFSENVSNVDITDFTLATSGTSGTISSVSASSGTTIDVTVNPVSGDGSLQLNLKSSGTGIVDDVNNAISGGFSGQSYTLGHIAPTVSSINRLTPVGPSTNATSVVFRITFSESVSNVDISDFTLATSGTSGTISSVSASSGTTIDVTINSVSGDGTLQLDLKSSGTGITDAATNAISGGFSGQSYTLDHTLPIVNSINRLTPSGASTNATSVIFRVTFSENVSNVDITDFTLATSGTTGTISSVSASSGTTIDVTVNPVSGDGSLQLNLKSSGTGIVDDVNNAISGGFSGQSYTLDHTAPIVSSINRLTPAGAGTNATTLVYRVTFSESVSGVDLSDFVLTPGSTGAGTISSVSSATGTIIDVTVTSVSGEGTLRLDLKSSGTGIADAVNNAISGGFITGQNYILDNTVPTANSINRLTPSGALTNATSVIFRATFSENVSNVDISDFTLATSGTSGTISSVSASSGTTIDVTVNPVSGDGTLQLNLKSSGTGITDDGGNAISGGFSGQSYTLDHTIPTVSSITLVGSTPNNLATDDYTVTFSESVTGVDMTDFTLFTTGGVTGSISGISGSGTTYAITVSSITGAGTMRLDLNASGTGITDAATNSVSGGYTAGAVYTIDRIAPIVSSITLVGSSPNNATSDQYTVTFSESVTGVDITDFTLFNTGVTGTVASVSGSGNSYTITINPVTGDGTMRLDLNSSGTGITDDVTNAISGGYTSGQSYTIDQTSPVVTSVSVPAPGNYTTGATLDVTVNWSEAVTITGGTPYVTIIMNSGAVQAAYVSGSGTTAFTFQYTVGSGDADLDGIAIGPSIAANGATLQDAVTNNAVLTLNSIGSTAGVYVNNTIPAFTGGTAQMFSVCANSSPYNLTSLLHVNDIDPGQTETWTISAATNNGGTLSGFGTPNAAGSGSTSITPGNVVTYTPDPGFSGTETFTIQVSDGIGGIATTNFIVTVNPLPVITSTSNTGPICAANTLTLNSAAGGGSGTLTYSWTGPNAFNQVGQDQDILSAPAAATGTYTLIVTDIYSCADTATTAATVYALPAITAINNNAPVCEEKTLTLSSTIAGGASPYTIGWTGPNGFSSADEDPTVTTAATVAANGPYTLTVTDMHNCSATGVNTTNVTVYPIQPIVGETTVAFGQTITLSDPVPGGSWTTPTPWITKVTPGNGDVKGVSVGTSQISYTTAFGCVATYTVTTYSLVNACVGQTITLSDGTAGGTWTSSNGSAATVVTATGVVTGVSAGKSVMIHKLAGGAVFSTTVTVNPLAIITGGTTTICQGQTMTLANGTVGGGTWYSSNTSVATVASNGTLYANSGGPVTVYFTPHAGCATSKVVTINAIAIITGIQVVCMSQTTILSSNVPGGTWSFGNGSFATVSPTTGVVYGVGTGGTGIQTRTTTILYQVSNGCYTTATVTVNALAPITGSMTVVCQGATIALSNTTVAGGTWTTDVVPKVSVSSTGMVTGTNAGVARVFFNTTTGCTATRTVTVNATPVIGGVPTVCVGQSTLLSSNVTGGTWSSATGSFATISATGNVSGVGKGIPRISYYIVATGCYSTASVTVNALSPITGGSTGMCASQTMTLGNATQGGGAWSSSNGAAANVNPTSGLVTGSGAGNTIISFTTTIGSCVATRNLTINACREGVPGEAPSIDEVAETSFDVQLFPNPNRGTFTLKGTLNVTNDEDVNVEVLNMLGQVIYRGSAKVQNGNIEERIQLQDNLASGTYMLRLHSANGGKMFQFVVGQ